MWLYQIHCVHTMTTRKRRRESLDMDIDSMFGMNLGVSTGSGLGGGGGPGRGLGMGGNTNINPLNSVSINRLNVHRAEVTSLFARTPGISRLSKMELINLQILDIMICRLCCGVCVLSKIGRNSNVTLFPFYHTFTIKLFEQ